LKPVFSICLVDGVVWKDSKEVHHRFQLHDKQTGRTLEETLEVHMLELRLFKLTEAELSGVSNKDRWLFWLLHAHEYDRERLLELFPEIAFQQATKTISAISEKEEDKIMYDAREKFVRDTQTAINAARDEGEARGEARGRLHGRITVLQQLAGLPEFSVEEFARYDEAGLKQLEAELQQQLRGRVL
ncbi:MAG: hypothetical protein FJ267_06005, partial [Planctomycetes bacterium]|nr:hypothetical protein [Planctomycetota bacterium]